MTILAVNKPSHEMSNESWQLGADECTADAKEDGP